MRTRPAPRALAELARKPHVLYRFFDATDVLLYVGITVDFTARFAQHRAEKEWIGQVANIRLEHYPNRGEALKAEREAILREKPLWNGTHNDGNDYEATDFLRVVDMVWLERNWKRLPSLTRDTVEVPAWIGGRTEYAEQLLDEFTDLERQLFTELGRQQALRDEDDDANQDDPARSMSAALKHLQTDIALLSWAVETLLDQLPPDLRERAAEYAQRRWNGMTAEDDTDTRALCRAARAGACHLALRSLDQLSERDRAAAISRAQEVFPHLPTDHWTVQILAGRFAQDVLAVRPLRLAVTQGKAIR